MGLLDPQPAVQTMKLLPSLCLTLMSVLVVSAKPVIDNPYLSILINRNDVGHSFNLGVNRQNQNLVITGPAAPYVGFPGSSTFYQRSYGHVAPFLAFQGYSPSTYP